MSSNILGAVVGGAVGFLVGGPAGALIGAGIGLAGSALVGGLGVGYDGPRLSDLSVQTSTYGADIPRVYSTITVAGNVLWLENNKLRERVRKSGGGGKGGGGGAETKTYTYYATFQLGLCEGPVAGVRRIWCSDKLIYDAGSDDLETIISSNNAAKKWTFYNGSDDQLPTARYQADVGVDNATGHRGLAYIEFRDFDLTDYGNTLQGAQFRVELVMSADTSTAQVGYVDAPYYQPHTSISFMPKPYFVSEEKIVFYAPQWAANYPEKSSWLEYELYTSGLMRTRSIGVTDGTGVPPNGDADKPGVYWKNKPFTGGGSFSGPDGYVQQRGDWVAGLSSFGGKRLYLRSLRTGEQKSVAVSASCFAVSGDRFFAITASSVIEYDDGLQIVATHAISMPAMSYPEARALIASDGRMLIFDGFSPAKVYSVDLQSDSVSLIGQTPVITGADYYSTSVALSETMLVVARPDGSTKKLLVTWYNLAAQSRGLQPLSAVLSREIELSGLLSAADVDATALTQEVKGYRVTGGSVRAALEPLAAAYQFDIIPSGYKLKAVPRGQASVLTVPYSDLGATSSDTPSDVFKMSREMDSQLPAKTVVKYLDAAREYDIGEQSSTRINTEAVNEVENELALVLGADEAAGIAEVLQSRAWLERTDVSFTLPPTYLALEPCDVITVQTPEADYELLASELEYTQDGRIEVKAKPNAAAVYTPNASGGKGTIQDGTIGIAGPSVFVPLDIPVVDETYQNQLGFVGVMTGYTEGWPGGVLYRSGDSGQTWTDIQGWGSACTIGTASEPLAAHDGYLIDQADLTVLLISGELESITRDQMLLGANYAAYGVDGRWEIVRFQNAVLEADGSYALSGFVRGDRGTEWATGLHEVGDWFILLADPENVFITMATESLTLERLYRGITQRASIDTGEDVEFAYRGVNLDPLSPVYARATRDGSGNLTGTFVRRSRLSSSWWSNGIVAPVGEYAEAYEIDVMSGSTVVRTITASTAAFAYSAADQTTDFGSPQSSITFRIYQLSEAVGRGYVREVTL
jgi:hypothetical protein